MKITTSNHGHGEQKLPLQPRPAAPPAHGRACSYIRVPGSSQPSSCSTPPWTSARRQASPLPPGKADVIPHLPRRRTKPRPHPPQTLVLYPLPTLPFSGRLQGLFVVFLVGSHRTGTCQTAQVLPGPSKELVLSRHLLAGVATGGRAAPELPVSDLSPEFLSSSCKGPCLLPKAKSARETHSLCCGCPGRAARSQLREREMGFGRPAALGP